MFSVQGWTDPERAYDELGAQTARQVVSLLPDDWTLAGTRVMDFGSGAWDSGGPAVLMSEWWVREHWGRAFEIVEIAPQFHNFSWAVMRKRDVELTDEDIDVPSDDPREYAAAAHNVRQLQRELELVAAQHQQALTENDRVRAELEQRLRGLELRIEQYENSLSWRVTRPLRRAAGSVRRARRGS